MRHRFLFVIGFLFAAAGDAAAADWFASRTQLDPSYDPHRSVVIWKSVPGTFANASMVGDAGTVACELAELTGQQWYDRYHATVTIPPAVKAGVYRLAVNGADTGLRFTVIARRERARATLSPDNIDKLESVAPHSDVTLTPGLYTLAKPLAVPRGVRVYGYGTTIRTAVPRAAGSAYEQLLFWPPADDLAFHGVTFLVSNNVLYGSPGQWANLHWNDCTFRPASRYYAGIGRHDYKNSLYTGCTFERVAATVDGGLLLDCQWRGMVAPRGEGHALTIDGGQSLCVARSRFDGTDRGPVLTDSTGVVRGVLITDIDLRGINRVDNGNELLLCESRNGREYSQCVFHRGRVSGCSGDINLWNARVSECVFNDWLIDDASLYFTGYGLQTGNLVTNCEFRGGGIYFAGSAAANTVRDCAFVGFRLTRRNQVIPTEYLYDAKAPRPSYRPLPVATAPLYSAAEANRPAKVNVIGKLAAGQSLEGSAPTQ